MKSDLEEGVFQDLGRCHFWTELSEIKGLIEMINHTIDHLDEYISDVHDDPAILFLDSEAYVRFEPLGVVLIMGSWNYPYFVTLKPLVIAIAAGNCALIKPSELGPAASKCIEILVNRLDSRCFRVIEGEAEVAIKLTQSKFDLIVFTGSTEKGKLVAKAAAANLVPCILELGGKCPLVTDLSTDWDDTARWICFGKFQNAGQICQGIDHVYVPEEKLQVLRENLLRWTKLQYGDCSSNQGYVSEVGWLIN